MTTFGWLIVLFLSLLGWWLTRILRATAKLPNPYPPEPVIRAQEATWEHDGWFLRMDQDLEKFIKDKV